MPSRLSKNQIPTGSILYLIPEFSIATFRIWLSPRLNPWASTETGENIRRRSYMGTLGLIIETEGCTVPVGLLFAWPKSIVVSSIVNSLSIVSLANLHTTDFRFDVLVRFLRAKTS